MAVTAAATNDDRQQQQQRQAQQSHQATPGDRARNLREDLEHYCARATPGPWRNTIRDGGAADVARAIRENGDLGVSQCSEAVVRDVQGSGDGVRRHSSTERDAQQNVICWMGPAAGGFTGPCVGGTDDILDARFIANARDGWPAAIRRALTAEAEVARLRDVVAALEGELARLLRDGGESGR